MPALLRPPAEHSTALRQQARCRRRRRRRLRRHRHHHRQCHRHHRVSSRCPAPAAQDNPHRCNHQRGLTAATTHRSGGVAVSGVGSLRRPPAGGRCPPAAGPGRGGRGPAATASHSTTSSALTVWEVIRKGLSGRALADPSLSGPPDCAVMRHPPPCSRPAHQVAHKPPVKGSSHRGRTTSTVAHTAGAACLPWRCPATLGSRRSLAQVVFLDPGTAQPCAPAAQEPRQQPDRRLAGPDGKAGGAGAGTGTDRRIGWARRMTANTTSGGRAS